MFCPHCRTEYREGFTICADCRIPLVTSLPAAERRGEGGGVPMGKFVEYLRTSDIGDIVILRSILDGGEVSYFIQDENINTLYPFMQSAILMVAEEDVEQVRELLKEVDLRYVRMIFGPREGK
jgi:hypothetical protein